MASSTFSLSRKRARTTRWVGTAFLLVALILAVFTTAAAVSPGISMHCGPEAQCRDVSDTTSILPEAARAAVLGDPVAHRHYDNWLAKPGVRTGLAAINLFQFGPMIFLFLSVGAALRAMGRQGGQGLERALPWLRHASRAAILLAVAQLLVRFLRSALLYAGMDRPELLDFTIDFNAMLLPLLMASAAYATVWALQAGIRAERDLASFV